MAVSPIQVYNHYILSTMSKQRRPSSCRLQQANRYSTVIFQQQGKIKKEQNIPSDSIQIKLSLKNRHIAFDSQALTVDTDSRTAVTPSKSKFLQKYNMIRSSRESIDIGKSPNVEEERKRKEDFESNKKKLFISTKLNHGSSSNFSANSHQIPQEAFPLSDNRLHAHFGDRRHARPVSPSIEFVELRKISKQELILQKEQGASKHVVDDIVTAFWKRQNRFVSLIPIARNEKVSFQHPNILPIYAEVAIASKRYVISDEYKNCSLKNLLEEFGPFQELLGKRYLKQIALGLQHMHYHRRGHNRLCPTAILYNKNGQLFINAVRSTSFVLSKEELNANKELHYFAPDFLLSKGYSKSLKNDVWALGCLAILMLTSCPLQLSTLHPYNFASFDNDIQEKMIDNLKQLHKTYFTLPIQPSKNAKAARNALSQPAKNFINKCLHPLSDERPSIQTLLQHQFLQGV